MMQAPLIFSFYVDEKPKTRQKVLNHNKQMGIAHPSFHHRSIDVSIDIAHPKLHSYYLSLPKSTIIPPKVPKTANKWLRKYHQQFNVIYFLIGQKNKGIWLAFENTYKSIFHDEQSLFNIGQANGESLDYLRQFLDEGMDVKLLIDSSKLSSDKLQEQLNYLNKKRLLGIMIDINLSFPQINYFENRSYKFQNLAEYFDKHIKEEIRKSFKGRDNIFYNFINTISGPEEVFKKKNTIQKSLQPQTKQEILQTLCEFYKMMQRQPDMRIQKQIELAKQNGDVYRYEKLIEKQKKQKNEQLGQIKGIIQKIQNMFPIENHNSKESLFFELVELYKKERSFYKIINNTIRLSFGINQKHMKAISPIVKYLNEAIQFYFRANMDQFKKLSKSITPQTTKVKVFRGCLFSTEQIDQLYRMLKQEDRFLFNIGFTSTTLKLQKTDAFRDKKNSNSFLLEIELNQNCFSEQFYENQEGFSYLPHIYSKMSRKEELAEDEVLFNPLNVFKLNQISIKNTDRIIKLQYSPHLSIIKALKYDKISDADRKKFTTMISHLRTVHRKNFDLGEVYRSNGQKQKALQFYEKAEKNGVTLDVKQISSKAQILLEQKQFSKVDEVLQKLVSLFQSQKQKGILKMSSVLNLTKQSQLLQKTQKFIEAQNKAEKANQKSIQLLAALFQQNNKQPSAEQLTQALQMQIKSQIELSKSKFQTNSNKESLCSSYVAFLFLEQFISILQNDIHFNIHYSFKQEAEYFKDKQFPEINKFLALKAQKFKLTNIDESSSLKFKNLSLKKSEENLTEENIQLKIQQINSFLSKREPSKKSFFGPFFQILAESEKISKKSDKIQKIQSVLFFMKEKIYFFLESERKLYEIITKNLKFMKKNVATCYKSQFVNVYGNTYETSIKTKQKGIDKIKDETRYAQFLLEYSQISNNKQYERIAFQKLQDQKNKISERQKQFKGHFTHENSFVQQIKLKHLKQSFEKQSIIEKQSNLINSSKSTSNSFKTVFGERNSQSYEELKNVLSILQKIQKSDSRINKYYSQLQLVKQKIFVYNNSFGLQQNYQEQLQKATKEAENFVREYIEVKNNENKRNQSLADFYFLSAQTLLRKGLYLQAKNKLDEALEIIEQIFKGNQLEILCALKSREIPLRCLRLQAEMVGVYGNLQKKVELYTKLKIQQHHIMNTVSNPMTRASICEAASFVGVRIIPKTIDSFKSEYVQNFKNIALQCQQMLQSSIELKQKCLGSQNQIVATDYSMLIFLLEKMEKNGISYKKQDLQRNFSKGKTAFKNIESEVKHNPILYLYKMKMQSSYCKIKSQESLLDIYKSHTDSFFQHRLQNFDVVMTDDIIQAGSYVQKKGNQEDKQRAGQWLDKLFDFMEKVMRYDQIKEFDFWKKFRESVAKTLKKIFKKTNNKQKLQKYRQIIKKIKRQNPQRSFLDNLIVQIHQCFGGDRHQN